MNGALVFLLALLWALVILPGALRSRRTSPASSVGTFERAMGVLARGEPNGYGGDGRYVYVPNDAVRISGDRAIRQQEIRARRRRTFMRLLVLTATSMLVAVVGGGQWWLMFATAGALLAGYVVLLLRWKSQAEQAAAAVRNLPAPARARPATAPLRPITEPVMPDRELLPIGAAFAAGGEVDPMGWESRPAVRIHRWEAART
ncbi:MAG: hypothetical protein M3N32_05630 [Actinomycetota bacterium]|nr:hypothetical protein [Actinomycetota bacterium]